MNVGLGVIFAGLALVALVGLGAKASASTGGSAATATATAGSATSSTTATGTSTSSAVPSGSEKQQIQQVAGSYHIAPQTLWGVYGTETSFGKNVTTSSAGAEGPFQFEPATWATYGAGGNIQSFSDALVGAAKYLASLGANSDPNSTATAAALNAYNGNGGGSSTLTSYFQSVLHLGATF